MYIKPGGPKVRLEERSAGVFRAAWGSVRQRTAVQTLVATLSAQGSQKAATMIEFFPPGLLNHTGFLKAHGKRIRTTKFMERVNQELK